MSKPTCEGKWLTLTDEQGVVIDRWFMPETTAQRVRDRVEGTLDVYESKEAWVTTMTIDE